MANDPPNISSSSPAPIPQAAGSIVSTDAGDVSSPSFMVSTPVREETENMEVRDESTPIGLGHVDTPCSDANVDTPISKVKDPMYVPDTPEMRGIGEARGGTTPFLTSAKQLDSLISAINRTSCCKAPNCKGELRVKDVELVDMGGDGKANFVCSGGCRTRDVCFLFRVTMRNPNKLLSLLPCKWHLFVLVQIMHSMRLF